MRGRLAGKRLVLVVRRGVAEELEHAAVAVGVDIRRRPLDGDERGLVQAHDTSPFADGLARVTRARHVEAVLAVGFRDDRLLTGSHQPDGIKYLFERLAVQGILAV